MTHGDDVCGFAEDRIAEVFVLGAQWFRFGDGVADDVAFANATELGDVVPLGGNCAVGDEGQVGGEGVGDECAAFAGDDGDA